MNFTKQELRQIQMGVHPEWQRIGDSSAYGGVYRSSKYPGKVVKVQSGDYRLFDNEIAKQFQAQLGNKGDYEVPKLGRAGFLPNNDLIPKQTDSRTGLLKYDPGTTGISYIEMDEADFANEISGGQQTRKHAKAKALTSLYNDAGVLHTDTHEGNIKYNPKTGKTVILDYGLARPGDGISGSGVRADRIRNLLSASGNTDMESLWNEQYAKLWGDHIQNPTVKTKAALDDWYRQGEEVGMRTDPNIAPVNWTKENPKSVDVQQPIKVTSSGATQWKSGAGGPGGLTSLMNRVNQLQDAAKTSTPPKVRKFGPASAGLSVGAADLIPSRETVKTAFKDGAGPALQNHASEFATGLPYGLGAAAVTYAAPAVAPLAVGAGGAMLLDQATGAIDEVVKQTTGESSQSKFRQFIGTEDRTGYASPYGSLEEKLKRARDRIDNPPQILPQTRKPRTPVKDLPMPEVGRRLRLAGERFNPSKLEFGISELLFGR